MTAYCIPYCMVEVRKGVVMGQICQARPMDCRRGNLLNALPNSDNEVLACLINERGSKT
jgi:hypothetical protein